jgi:hypothetical protein
MIGSSMQLYRPDGLCQYKRNQPFNLPAMAMELMVLGKWVASHARMPIMSRYAKLWMPADGEVTARQQHKIAKLRERLALK